MRGRAILVGLILLFTAASPLANETASLENADDARAARAVVDSLHAVLLGCMKRSDELGFAGRYARILANLDETFDLAFMARMSIGRDWKDLSEQQRIDFMAQSRRYSASNYASNFKGYGGQHFETLDDAPAAHRTLVVKTELVQPKDDDVRFDYRLRKSADGWRIIDVQLDGKVSEITLRRADYRSVIQRQGFEALTRSIEEKIEKFADE
jgi:phospholipid transport system substrate-binding protein